MSFNYDELAKELDPFLEKYGREKAGAEQRLDHEQEQAFLARFERIKVEIILPVIQHIGEYLEERGHSFQVEEEDVGMSNGNPSIKMKIYPRVSGGSVMEEHEFPVISFVAEPDISSVGIEVLDGMPGRPGVTRGHVVPIDSITPEYVKSQIIGLIKKSFGKKSPAAT